jgi:hypothetical protein
MDTAARICDGRVVIEHEGGYAEEFVPFCGLAVVETLSGIQTECQDSPLHQVAESFGQQGLQPHQEAAIQAAEELLAGIPAT